jgi:hypothetical protein
VFDALSCEGPASHNHFAPAGGSSSCGAGLEEMGREVAAQLRIFP